MPRRPGTTTFARRLGARIRMLRKEVGITQERLAWDCDLDKGYLSQVEAGKRLPSLTVLVALAERMGVEVADVLLLDTEQPRLELQDAVRRGDREVVTELLKRLGLA